MPKRGKLGLKPLYYWDGPNERIFADSVRELLRAGAPRKLSREGLKSYLSCGAVQEPLTLVEGIRSVAPEPLEIRGNPYGSIDDAQQAVSAALFDAVRQTACTSAFLSGGIDSGAIVALMRKAWPDEELKTYCVVHEDPRTDERQWARLTAERNRTKHTEMMLTGQMVTNDIEACLKDFDQPSVDGVNSWFAAKLVKESGCDQILSGEGGDELFVGYGQFAKPRQAYALAQKLGCFRGSYPLRLFGSALTRCASKEKIKKLGQLLGSTCDPYYLTRRQFDDAWINRLLKPEFRFEGDFERLSTELPKDDLINRLSLLEIRNNLLSMYVRDGYQTSVCHHLDVLAPILDEKVVELVLSIPGEWKCDAKISKPMLVRAADDGLPTECVMRRKQGFALPFDKYFREGLKEELEMFVRGGGCGLFEPTEIAKIWSAYLAGKTSWMRIWQVFALDHWIRQNKIEL